MKLLNIYEQLDSISPFILQEKWDNSGLNVGSLNQTIEHIHIVLEATFEIIENLKPNSLLITHHPLIFSPLKNFNQFDYPANLIKSLVIKNCALISMHTNFDSTHLNEFFAKNILGFDNLENKGIAKSATIKPTDIKTLSKNIANKMNLDSIKIVEAQRKIQKVYVICGSGASFINSLDSTEPACLITGDVKFHDAMRAKALNLSIIDVGHYESERYFGELLKENLQIKGEKIIIESNFSPFSYQGQQ